MISRKNKHLLTLSLTLLSQEKILNQHSSYIQSLLNKRQNIPKIYAYLYEYLFFIIKKFHIEFN